MNANHTETDIEKFRNLLSPIKNLAALLRVIEKNGIDQEYKQSILDMEIPETLKICSGNRAEMFKLAKDIDLHLITYLNQCYELNDSLLDSPRIDHIYEMNQYEKEVLLPIMEIIANAEMKEHKKAIISSLYDYYLFKDSGVEDLEREKLLKNRIEKYTPQIEELVGITT